MPSSDSTYNRYQPDPQAFRSTRRKRRRANGHGKRWVKIAALIIGVLFIAFVAASAGAIMALSRNLPRLDAQHRLLNARTTVIYDRSGHIIAQLHGAQNRTIVSSKGIPQVMKDATVASEDWRFYQHHGIDFVRLLRALFADLQAGRVVQGGSTITEQFVKNAYVGNDPSVTRKLREAVLAWQLEDKWSKDQILTEYLNTVYYGHGAYGVEAAAETYFHEHARKLTLTQAALLVAAAKLPTDYDPILNAKAALAVHDEVLDAMARHGYITPAQAEAAKTAKLNIYASPPNTVSDPAAYFIDYVTQELVRRFGVSEVFEGGLRVYTSLDSNWQKDALNVVKNTITPLNFGFKPSAALVAVEPTTGYIRAMVGGLDFKKQQFNLAAQARRQPGSAMKPFVLTAAVEQGMNPFTTYYPSASPVVIPMGWGAPPWIVHGDGTGGPETIAYATQISDNAVFARLSVDVGPSNTAEVAHRMGITSPLDEVPSITLGTSVVTPLEMADAYATLADNGIHHVPQAIVKIVLPNHHTLWKPDTKGNRAIDAGVASTVTRCLELVATGGTGASTGSYFPYMRAGKTGTTEKSWDVWYVGYTPQLSAAVWMGNMVKNSPMSGAFGGIYCAPMWAKFFALALQNQPHPDFQYAAWTFKPWHGKHATASASPSASPSASASGKPTPTPTGTKTIKPSPTPTKTKTPTPTPTPTKTPTPTPTPTVSKSP